MRTHIEPKKESISCEPKYSAVYPDSLALGASIFPNTYGEEQHHFAEPPGPAIFFVHDGNQSGFYYAPGPLEWQQQREPVTGFGEHQTDPRVNTRINWLTSRSMI